MPVYWYSIPAQIKGVIDRIFSLVVGGKDIAGKKCALNKWEMVGEVLIPGVLNPGDIDKTDGCKQAAALAESI